VDYYTDAIRYTQVRVLEIAGDGAGRRVGRGPSPSRKTQGKRARPLQRIAKSTAMSGCATLDLMGTCWCGSQVVGFKKIKFFTNENIGAGAARIARERDAHDVLLDYAGAGIARIAAVHDQRAAVGDVRVCCMRWRRWLRLLLMCDGARFGNCDWRAARPRRGRKATSSRPMRLEEAAGAQAKEFFRAEFVFV